MKLPQRVVGEYKVPDSLRSPQLDVVLPHQIDGADDEGKIVGQILDYLVNGSEVHQILLPEILPLL
jgi:hypothetical protein